MTGIQGWLLEHIGGFSVDPVSPTVSSMRTAIEVLHNRKKLVIFPEGGIVRDQPLRPLKTGLARLVLQAEATSPQSIPIIPISLHYSSNVSLRSEVFVYISPPLHTEQCRQPTDKLTAQSLTEALQKSLLSGLEVMKRIK